ncbi:MAG: glycoside hydrolase family 32 protein [Bacillota bacterium]
MAENLEPYRPLYHFTPPHGWINDPNGLVCFRDQWHLFYQYYESGQVDGMQWGHAVSSDLIRWKHLPPAIGPDQHGQIWSGSAVVDHSDTSGLFHGQAGMVCFFTYWNSSDNMQCQGMAYSPDGFTFYKFSGNPVIPYLPDGEKEFRDPKVFWHTRSRRWIMAVAGGKLRVYSSSNLLDWQFENINEGLETECPDLFELPVDGGKSEHKWILSGGGRWYMIGDFDGKCFIPRSERLPMNHGPDFYATQSWSDAPGGRRITISWLFNWIYKSRPVHGRIQNSFPTQPWSGGCLTVPCELSLRTTSEGLRLVQHPAPELERFRAPLCDIKNLLIKPGSVNPLDGVRGKALDIELVVQSPLRSFWNLRIPANSDRFYTVGFDAEKKSLFLDRTSGGFEAAPSFAERYEAPLPIRPDGSVSLRILTDGCSIEVFDETGLVTMSAFILPDPAADDIVFESSGSDVAIRRLAVYALQTRNAAFE